MGSNHRKPSFVRRNALLLIRHVPSIRKHYASGTRRMHEHLLHRRRGGVRITFKIRVQSLKKNKNKSMTSTLTHTPLIDNHTLNSKMIKYFFFLFSGLGYMLMGPGMFTKSIQIIYYFNMLFY